jgi:two-component system nitrate/nitrite response regulator NarL
MIRVHVVAPSAAGRAALRARVEGPGIEVVGEGPAVDGAPADVDLVLLGTLPPVAMASGESAGAAPGALVAVTDDPRAAATLAGRAARSWGVVPTDGSRADLRAAVAAVARGFAVLPAALAARLLPRASGPPPAAGSPPDGAVEPLTPREREVLDLLAQGLTNRRIAERLGISEHTAKFHVAAICGKLGAATRAEAVTRGLRGGLITL